MFSDQTTHRVKNIPKEKKSLNFHFISLSLVLNKDRLIPELVETCWFVLTFLYLILFSVSLYNTLWLTYLPAECFLTFSVFQVDLIFVSDDLI